MVEDIAGDRADVQVLLDGAASPHHYSLRISDVRKVQRADLLVWLGPEFERFLTRLAEGRAERSLTLAQLPGLAVGHEPHHTARTDGPAEAHHHHGQDLHLWLSPANGAVMLDAIAQRLSELRPAAAPEFSANLQRAKAGLAAADQSVAARLRPHASHGFGVSHDAFGYFADHFNLTQLAAVSALPDQSLSAKHTMETINRLRDARCLIVEAGEPANATARLQQLVKLPIVKADPLALNPEIKTYAELILDLGRSFEECLGG